MRKYRIVKLSNGKYAVQSRLSFFSKWFSYTTMHDTFEQAKENYAWHINYDLDREERRKLKVVEVVYG